MADSGSGSTIGARECFLDDVRAEVGVLVGDAARLLDGAIGDRFDEGGVLGQSALAAVAAEFWVTPWLEWETQADTGDEFAVKRR
jgi:hypothetical protein